MNRQEKKVYTAQEMRKMAEEFAEDARAAIGCADVEIGKEWVEQENTVVAMLLQAAEMTERCVQMREKYIPYYGQNDGEVDAIIDTVDFVQTGKES